MEFTWQVVVGIIAGVLLIYSFAKKNPYATGQTKGVIVTLALVGIVIGLVGGTGSLLVQTGGVGNFFAVAGTGAGAGAGVDTGAIVETPISPTTPSGVALPVNTLTLVNVAEKGSNKLAVITGAFHFYKSGTDPKSATANAIDVVSVVSGAGSSTNKTLTTNTAYRVVFKGAGTYYDKDYGEYTINNKNFNPNTGEAQFDAGDIATVGTISNFFTEPRNSSIGGQTSFLLGTDELGNTTSDILVYDESVGDESYYLDVILGITGANTYLKKPVFCFENDLSNPPDNNDYTAITSSTRTGDRYKLDSDLIAYWKDQKCYALPMDSGDYEKAGSSTTVRITFTPVEANLDANDDFFFLIDDLGGARAVDDSGSNRGATIVRTGIDHQA